jgi:predicted ATP-grasp superfamily ATP-dependent carboligase
MIEQLVILGSTLTALAVVRDAHHHGVRPVVVDDADGIAFRSRHAVAVRVDRGGGDDAVVERLRALAGSASALVATGDPWVRFVMRLRPWLDASFGAVLHPANDALDTCLDKQRFAAWCRARGLDAPRSWLAGIESRPGGLQPPLLVRPAQTLHGHAQFGLPKAAEVQSEDALAALLARFAAAGCPALVSESLLGQQLIQYSVPFARRGAELQSFVARKLRPAPERCAVGTYVELQPQPAVEALARRAVEALDYYGIGEVEVLHAAASGRNCLIEINARPWLQYALAPASGHDFLGLMLGRPLAPRRPRTTGLRWIDFRADLFGALSRSEGVVRRGQLGWFAYLASLARANVHARLDWRDPAPALHGDALARAAGLRAQAPAARTR